jgi:hypothetical protein
MGTMTAQFLVGTPHQNHDGIQLWFPPNLQGTVLRF